jgi:hypothetical protein
LLKEMKSEPLLKEMKSEPPRQPKSVIDELVGRREEL